MTLLNDFINTHCKYVKSLVGDMMKRLRSTRVIAFVNNVFWSCMIDVASEFNLPFYVYFNSYSDFIGFNLYIQKLCDTKNQDVSEFTNSDTRMLSSCLRTLSNRYQPKSFLLCTKTKKGWPFFMIMYGNCNRRKQSWWIHTWSWKHMKFRPSLTHLHFSP